MYHHHHHQITKLSHSINAIGPAPQDMYETPPLQLRDEIRWCFDWIAPDVGRILGCVDEWNPVHYTVVVPQHPTVTSDMDISDSSGSDMDLD
jgi:hypothetical protein